MKNIVLKRLVLKNYRNIELGVYEFNGNSKIVGENRIGKTNTLEAIHWLLTDYLLDGSSDMAQLKPLTDTKKVVSVEGIFDIDGYALSIKKEFREKWVKTRGTSDLIMQGHETLYYINDVKQATLKGFNKEFEAQTGLDLSKCKANIDLKRCLVDPYYLGDLGETLNWKDFRSFIIDIVGDVSDNDVFAHDNTLEIIKEDLAKQNGRIEQAKKYTIQTIKTLKQDILVNNGSIDNLSQVAKPSEEEIAIARKGIEEHETNIANLRANSGTDEASHQIEVKLTDVRSSIADVREQILNQPNPTQDKIKEVNAEISNYQRQIDQLLDKKRNFLNEKAKTEREIDDFKHKVENCDKIRTDLIRQIKGIEVDIENAPTNAIKECPYCHRPYEEGKVVESVNQIIDELNAKKDKLIQEGIANKSTKCEHNANLEIKQEALEVTLNSLHNVEGEIVQINTKLEVAKVKLEELENTPVNQNTELTDKLESLIGQRDQLEKELEESKLQFARGTQDNFKRIEEETNAMTPFKKVIADLDFYDRTQIEIGKLREHGQVIARELAVVEQKFEALNRFIRVKLEMLDSNVKKVFDNIKFQLIKENINGGYDAVCKPYIYDVEKGVSTSVIWKSGSRSERVITGIAILNKIKEALQLPNFPILFDQGGEISSETFANRIKTESQIICVQVQDNVLTPLVLEL